MSPSPPLEAPAKPGAVTEGPAAEGPVQVGGITMAHQDKLPHLPIPPLDDTMKRYLRALEGLQVSTECSSERSAPRSELRVRAR